MANHDPNFDKSDEKLRVGLVTALLGLLISPNYDPTTEGQKLLATLGTFKNDPQWKVLETLSARMHKMVTGLDNKRDISDEARTLLHKLFAEFDGTKLQTKDAYAEAAGELYDAANGAPKRVGRRPPTLEAGYGDADNSQAEEDARLEGEFDAVVKEIHATTGIAMCQMHKDKLRETLRRVYTTGKPELFELPGGDAFVVGSTRHGSAGIDEVLAEAAKKGFTRDPIGELLNALLGPKRRG